MRELSEEELCAELYALMHKKRKIRNISVIAAPGAGKSTLTDELVAVTQSTADHTSEDLSDQLLKADGFSFMFEIDHDSAKTLGGKHIINFVKSSDYCDALQIVDGAYIVVDYVEGVSPKTEAILQQALDKSIGFTLAINKFDLCFLEHHDGEKAYNTLFCAIESVNRIIAEHDDKTLGLKSIYPEKGMVAFSSGLQGWGFTLSYFAKIYGPMHGLSHSKMMKKLWGDNFFDSKTRKWTNKPTGSPSCKRGFVQFCFDPLAEVISLCMTCQNDILSNMLKKFGVLLKPEDLKLMGEDLLKFVMQSWLPLGRPLLEMAVAHLPSPTKAQKYRLLHEGPLSDEYTESIRNCDVNGPTLFYASKTWQASGTEKFTAFGRVISGRLEVGKKVNIASAKNGFDQMQDIYVHSIHSTTACLNNCPEYFSDIPCGNVVYLVGVTKEGMLSNEKEFDARSIKAWKYERKAPEHDKSVKNFRLQPSGQLNKVYELPLKIYKRLHPHQLEAVQWLWGLHCRRKGGLYADDMGMGKTRTISSFLRGLFHSKVIKRAIIVVPLTIVRQWEGELAHVKLKNITQTYTDGKCEVQQKLLQHVIEEGGIVLTTYDVFKNSKDIICEEDAWDYIFLDEAHLIKNQDAQVSKSFNAVTTAHRILMTGTPFQNEFKEFYALMNFCVPGLLGNEVSFYNNFAFPIERGKYIDSKDKHKRQSKNAAKRLRAVIKPFILRRTKKLLQAKGLLLANKYEMTIWLKLTDMQRDLYTNLMTNLDIDMKVNGAPFAQSRVAKNICNHPVILTENQDGGSESKAGLAKKYTRELLELVPVDSTDVLNCSCKVRFTMYLVRKLLPDFKLLIFTQSIPMLRLLLRALSTIMDKRRLIFMDGSINKLQRDRLIKDFQADDEDLKNRFMHKGQGPLVFLMTTGVGGVGLNLTAASRVIIVDPALNPVVDNQSVDRVFRYGQQIDVKIYRLISCGTIEEHIYWNQVLKGELSTAVTEKEQSRRGLAKEKKKVLTLPERKDGFWVSSTHRELGRRFNVDNFEGCEEDVKLVQEHELVASVSNHSHLFSLAEENFPWECEEQSTEVNPPGPSYKKPKSDYISDRDEVVFRLGKNPGTELRMGLCHKHKTVTYKPAKSKQLP